MKFKLNKIMLALILSTPAFVNAQNINENIYVDVDKVAIGEGALVVDKGVAVGNDTEAWFDSVALGNEANAKNDSVAVGNNLFSNYGSTVIGTNGSSAGIQSVSVGSNVRAGDESIGFGKDLYVSGKGIGIGSGIVQSAGGPSILLGNQGYVEQRSIVVGNNSTATVDSISIGNNNSIAGESIGIGKDIGILGNWAIGIGSGSYSATYGVAIGDNSEAGLNSVALGSGSISTNDSVAIGFNSEAGPNSVALGSGSKSVYDGVAIGFNSEAGHNSVALGNSTIVTRVGEVGIGNRTLGGVANATENDQAVNLGQLKSAIAGVGVGGGGTVDPNSVLYHNDDGSIVIFKGTDGTELRNVSAGYLDNSAANVGQVKQAITTANNYTDLKFDSLEQLIQNLPDGGGGTGGTDPNAIVYDSSTGSTATLKGVGGTELRNVKAGTTADSAVNVAQMNQAKQESITTSNNYTDLKFDSLEQFIQNLPSGGGGTGGTDPNAIVYDSSTGSTATLKGVGGTELRNVKAGTTDDSAVNVAQMNQAKQEAITTSNNYTDVKTAENLVQANQYTDNKAVETLTKANQYTDEQVKDKVAYDNDAGSVVTFKGQEGTELRNVRAGTTGTSAVNLQQLHQAQQGLQRYADEGDMRTLQKANQYTDNRFNKLDKKLNGVSAMSSAQSNIIYNPYGSQYQLGLGVGASGGESAVSMKFMGTTNDKRVIYSFGVSKATSGKATYGAGVSWSF